MKTKTVVWIVLAVALTLLGTMIFAAALASVGWDFSKLSTVGYETNVHHIEKEFESISVNCDTADIVLIPSENEKASVECFEESSAKHSVTVEDGTLKIELVDTRKWYRYIGINLKTPRITVSVPVGQYGALTASSSTGDVTIPEGFTFSAVSISSSTGDVEIRARATGDIKIKTSTGDVQLENTSAESIGLSSSTGDTTLSRVDCESLTSNASTGDITLKSVNVTKKLYAKTSTGDVELFSSDAAEIYIETDTGDVTGSLLTEKTFIAESDTGSIDVPHGSGGPCEIITDTGDVELTVSSLN